MCHGKHVISRSSQYLLFCWSVLEAKTRFSRIATISWFHASFVCVLWAIFFCKVHLTEHMARTCAVQRFEHIYLYGYLALFNHTINMIVWSINIQHSTFAQISNTQADTHTHTCTIQIEHCHFVVNRITYNIQRIICVPILVQVLMQCCISPSFIIIKIDVEHLMRKLLFHDEFTNRTSICR